MLVSHVWISGPNLEIISLCVFGNKTINLTQCFYTSSFTSYHRNNKASGLLTPKTENSSGYEREKNPKIKTSNKDWKTLSRSQKACTSCDSCLRGCYWVLSRGPKLWLQALFLLCYFKNVKDETIRYIDLCLQF